MTETTTETFVNGFVDDILTEISLNHESKTQKKQKKADTKETQRRPLGKLELYKSRQFYCRDPDLQISEEEESGGDELFCCPLCLLITKKSEYSKHCKRSERHSSYLQIEDLYLTYCDRRRINPVSCHVQELQSFIQRLAWSPEENILPVWIYLASRHEADLTSFDVVRAVLESPLRRRRSHQICPTEESMPTSYACYSCPYFCRTAQDLFRHVHGEEHAAAIKDWSLRGKKGGSPTSSIFINLFCDYCDEEFSDEPSLQLHRFGKKHLGGGRLRSEPSFVPCVLCDTDKDDFDLKHHVGEIDHVERESMADGFLIFCYQNGLEIPLNISPESLIRFLETLPVSSLLPNVRLLRRLFGSDANPSCPFNHKKVKIFISYTELSGSVYSPELSNKIIDHLTRCGYEQESCSDSRFERTTKLLYHTVACHRVSPYEALKGFFQKIENEESWCEKKAKTCKDCPSLSFTSPLVYALHKDAHETLIECEFCKIEYKSVVEYYYRDKCGENDIEQSSKDLVDQMIKTTLLTSEVGIPLHMEAHPNFNFPHSIAKKRKRTYSSEVTDEEGLVGHWLLNCPTVRARKISVASRKRVDGEDSDNSDSSVHSSKIVLNGSPQILPEVEGEKDISGNHRKRPKLVQAASRTVEKPLRKRLSDRILHPPSKSQWTETQGLKSGRNESNQRSCRMISTKGVNEPVKKNNVVGEKKTTPKIPSKFSSPRISPALTNSQLPRQNTTKPKLNHSRSLLFKKDEKTSSVIGQLTGRMKSPNLNPSKPTDVKGSSQLKGRALPLSLKMSRKSEIPMKVKLPEFKKSEAKRSSFGGSSDRVSTASITQVSKKLNETITTKVLDAPGSPLMSRSSTFVKNGDSEDLGSQESFITSSSPRSKVTANVEILS